MLIFIHAQHFPTGTTYGQIVMPGVPPFPLDQALTGPWRIVMHALFFYTEVNRGGSHCDQSICLCIENGIERRQENVWVGYEEHPVGPGLMRLASRHDERSAGRRCLARELHPLSTAIIPNIR